MFISCSHKITGNYGSEKLSSFAVAIAKQSQSNLAEQISLYIFNKK
jgi:hypothetical protein